MHGTNVKIGEQLLDSLLGHFHLFSKLSKVALGIIQPTNQ